MSLLTYKELVELVEDGVITDTPIDRVNGASIDVTLGRMFLREDVDDDRVIDLAAKESPKMNVFTLGEQDAFHLNPGDFVLGHTEQTFNLPNDIAIKFELKSSLARSGLNHALAGWGDPGWNRSVLTLELSNMLAFHTLKLRPGMKVGQVVFWRGEMVPDEASYARRGQYNGDRSATPSKGVR